MHLDKNLLEIVSEETHIIPEAIMFLRHGNDSVARLRHHGSTILEYTAIQPVGSKYDYFHPTKPRIVVVAVIVDDHVYAVYQVIGIEATGTNYSLATEAYKRFDEENRSPEIACHRYHLEPTDSMCVGLAVRGWGASRTRTPVQRHGDGFFHLLAVSITPGEARQQEVERTFEEKVKQSARDTSEARQRRLATAKRMPYRVPVTSFVYSRNPDVVAEVLYRAKGTCQRCSEPAPFKRRSDNSPYLEVHHRKPLSEHGEDTVENAIALCPNCHRQSHYA
jgi:5-methylcytosine-specific restriction endonuclease McrA